jgi:hypothetical protein
MLGLAGFSAALTRFVIKRKKAGNPQFSSRENGTEVMKPLPG